LGVAGKIPKGRLLDIAINERVLDERGHR
jgi:hypothetical protein